MNNPFLEAEVTAADSRLFSKIALTWNVLQNHLDSLDEAELCKLMAWELDNQQRMYVVNRIKSRHNRLRDARERKELFSK